MGLPPLTLVGISILFLAPALPLTLPIVMTVVTTAALIGMMGMVGTLIGGFSLVFLESLIEKRSLEKRVNIGQKITNVFQFFKNNPPLNSNNVEKLMENNKPNQNID